MDKTNKLSQKNKRKSTTLVTSSENVESQNSGQKSRQKPYTLTSSDNDEDDETKGRNKICIPNIIKEGGAGCDALLRTRDLYYVSYYEPIADQIDISSRKDIISNAKTQLQGELPIR